MQKLITALSIIPFLGLIVKLVIMRTNQGEIESINLIIDIIIAAFALLVTYLAFKESQKCIVYIPQLSTFKDYKQQLIVTNLSKKPIKYKVEYFLDTKVLTEPLAKSSGQIDGNQTITLYVYELVKLTGSSMISASISFDTSFNKIAVTHRTRDILSNSYRDAVLAAK